jgi:hypothetical protein
MSQPEYHDQPASTYVTTTTARNVYPWGYRANRSMNYMTAQTTRRAITVMLMDGRTGLTIVRNI